MYYTGYGIFKLFDLRIRKYGPTTAIILSIMSKNTKLSVVIPAFKEVDNIKKGVLKEVYDYLSNKKYTWEVLVVDDGSPDNTYDIAKKATENYRNFKVLKMPHRGKGATVIAGVMAASGEYVLFTDMDQATPISEVEKFFEAFEKGADIVIGSRSGREGAPLSRKAMAYGFMLLRALILRLPYSDTQCGFKAFTKESAKKIFQKMKVFTANKNESGAAVNAGFDLELLYIGRKLGYKIKEVPVVWHHKDTKRVNPIKDSVSGLLDLLRVRFNALSGQYK